jgi:LPS-assembly protein
MPRLMPRWSPFCAALLILGGIPPLRAAQPTCPMPSPTPLAALSAADLEPAPTGPRLPGLKSPAAGKIDIWSDHASLSADGLMKLTGHVLVRQDHRRIEANRLDYDSRDNSLGTHGGITFSDPLVHVSGKGGHYSPTGGAVFHSARFHLERRPGRGAARELALSPGGVLHLSDVEFTTCPADDRSWMLRARSITLDTRRKVGYGRDTRIDFQGVPILYLPWVSFPLGNVRKSGFLFPTVGNTSRSGALLSIPYYWNIAPNADFTFEPTEYTRRGPDLGGEFRFLTASSHGTLDWDYLPADAVYHGSRSRIQLLDVTELPGGFRLGLQAENVSDAQYFEDFSSGPEGTSTAFLDRRAELSYRDVHWNIEATAQQFQTIDTTLPLDERPYARVPDLKVSADYGWGPGDLVRYGFESEVVDFQRSTGITGWRLDMKPVTSLDFDGPGYFLRPSVAWRVTQYELSGTLPGEPSAPSRVLPIASVDTGLELERASGSHAQRTITLEPRVMYLYVPYRDQSDLPIFDTAVPDLDPVELFRTNRYVGADRVGDANQVSVGATTRLLDARNGRQYLAATIGEEFYFTTPRVTLPGEFVHTDRRSDLVAQLSLTAFQHWSAYGALQWDPQTSQTQRAQVDVQYRPGPERVINVGYRFERGILSPTTLVGGVPTTCGTEATPACSPSCVLQVTGSCDLRQVEVSGAWPIGRSWNIFARGVYSLADHEALERFAGFEYRSCCWSARIGARRFVGARPTGTGARTGTQDTGIYLQLELTGLASVGSAPDAFLREAIPGYTPSAAAATGSRADTLP